MISNGYPDFPESYRGIFIRKLCLELKKQDIEVIVLTPQVFKQSPRFEIDEGIPVHRFWYPSGGKPLGQADGVPLIPMCIYMLTGLIKALLLVFKNRPDVIHGNWIVPTGLIAAIAGKLTNTPVINTARGMDTRIGKRGPIKLLFNLAARLSKRLVVVSKPMQEIAGLETADIIPSGQDHIFSNIPIGNRPPVVIYARSMEKIYDPATFIKAIPHVIDERPDARFIMAGGGSMLHDMKTLADNLDITDNLTFKGVVPHAEVASIMAQAKIFVSAATEDGTSIALLEAMSAGLIPIATNIEANRSWIKHEKDGYLFKPGNENDLAANILAALSDKIDDKELEQKRKRITETTSWRSIVKRYVDLYKSMT